MVVLKPDKIQDDETAQTASPSSTGTVSSDGSAAVETERKRSTKLMGVTITVLSLDGIITKDNGTRDKTMNIPNSMLQKANIMNKHKSDEKRTDSTAASSDSCVGTHSATIVASFAQSVATGERKFLTHVPSLPMQLKSSVSPEENVQNVVHWPGHAAEGGAEDGERALSTFQFKRHFQHEGSTNNAITASEDESLTKNYSPRRFVPQTCPINLSLSRNGKLVVLGNANIIINGEEKGEASVTVPIASDIRPMKSTSPIKKIRKGKDMHIPMTKVKGDRFQFGLKGDAMLRVLVNVSEYDGVIQENDEEQKENVVKNLFTDDSKEVDSVSECSSNGSEREQEDWEEYIRIHSELRQLRQELVKSENMNKVLESELCTTRELAQQANEKLLTELEGMQQKSQEEMENLRQELRQAKSEAEMLPIYEARINELMEELKNKDTEVQCLREEISEVKQSYKTQVDSLLWDNEDEETKSNTNDATTKIEKSEVNVSESKNQNTGGVERAVRNNPKLAMFARNLGRLYIENCATAQPKAPSLPKEDATHDPDPSEDSNENISTESVEEKVEPAEEEVKVT